MSTHGQIDFLSQFDGKEVESSVWQHWDGYPSAVLPELHEFFTEVVKQCGEDTRFDDASILASRWVVFKAFKSNDDAKKSHKMVKVKGEFVFKDIKPKKITEKNHLKFLNVRVVRGSDQDAEYIYHVDCSKQTLEGFPVVSFKTSYDPGAPEVYPLSLIDWEESAEV